MDLDEDKAERYEGPRMCARLWTPRPGVVVTRVSGHVDVGATHFYTRFVDQELEKHDMIQVFHDWIGIRGFDPDVRFPYRDWANRVQSRVTPTFLVSSKVLAMALSVTALMLGRELVILTDAAAFRRLLEAELS